MNDSRNFSKLTADDVLAILKSYRCRYHRHSGDSGGMLLIDALTPAEDRMLERGDEELRLSADHIAAELSEQRFLESSGK